MNSNERWIIDKLFNQHALKNKLDLANRSFNRVCFGSMLCTGRRPNKQAIRIVESGSSQVSSDRVYFVSI